MTRTVQAIAALAVVLVVALLLVWHFWSLSASSGTKNAVVTGQLGASTESGKDAIGSVANEADAVQTGVDLSRNNADAIDQANGSTIAVTPESQDAGLRALCRRPAYAGNASCAAYR